MSALEDPRAFAEGWAAAWNRKDIEAVLSHFAEDARFSSPKAEVIAGTPELVGKAALRAYWAQAVTRIGVIRFAIERVVVDRDARTLLIVYQGQLDSRRVLAGELLTFSPAGEVIRGDALYGASLPG
jgi:ketosteroid isomerase-like protein